MLVFLTLLFAFVAVMLELWIVHRDRTGVWRREAPAAADAWTYSPTIVSLFERQSKGRIWN